MPAPLFAIDDLHVSRVVAAGDDPTVEVVRGVSLEVNEGEIHVLIGPDDTDLSCLASALLGFPGHDVTGGSIEFRGDDITLWGTDVRAKAGMFLASSDPEEITGVGMLHLLGHAMSTRSGVETSVVELRRSLIDWMGRLGIDDAILDRHVNEGCTPGEKQHSEVLQMAILAPDLAILDETNPRLDDDDLRVVATGVREVRKERPRLGTLAITHHQRLLQHLQPDVVHVMVDGTVVASGGTELALALETNGYESFR